MKLHRPLFRSLNDLVHVMRAGYRAPPRQKLLRATVPPSKHLGVRAQGSASNSSYVIPPFARSSLHRPQQSRAFASSTNSRHLRPDVFRRFPHAFFRRPQHQLRYNHANPNPTPHLNSPPSLSERLRKLSREYGWSAVGVYLALSALDFPFCFLAVRWLGTERIGRWEEAVIERVRDAIVLVYPGAWPRNNQEGGDGVEGAAKMLVGGEVPETTEEATEREGRLGWTDEVVAAEKANTGAGASLGTQLALAYAIHKSFIFVRVPLTAAVLPKVVKTLRGWGYNIGKRRPKGAPK